MSPRTAAWLAWSLCGITTSLALVLFAVKLSRQDGSTTVVQFADEAILLLAMPLVCGSVAGLIVSRHPRHPIGWLLLVLLSSFLVGGSIELYLQLLGPSPEPTLPLLLLVWFSGWSWVLLIFPLLLIVLLFPTGQPPTPRWRWVRGAAIVWATLFVLLVTVSQPIRANTTPDVVLDNPIGVLSQDTSEMLAGVWIAGLLALVVLCVAALVVRYRRATATERQQLKWLMAAGAVFLVVYVGGAIGGLGGSTGVAADLWGVCFALSVVALPAAIGIAILRYRLYEIDLLINRTLVYGLLTGALVLVYWGSVVLLQALFRTLSGQGQELAIIASTLAIAALFQPLRQRIQAFIDHRFYRRKYDAAQVLAALSATLRDETDVDRLADEVLAVVQQTMQPTHVSLWLRPPQRPTASPPEQAGQDADSGAG